MGTVRKVLCSIGAGPHAELLAVSGQTFRIYAERHSYDLCLRNELPVPQRPASWSKVRLIQTLLAHYDLVLWIDADAAVVDASIDVAGLLDRRQLMGVVTHATPEGDDRIPNCGVWVLRRHRRTRRFLEDVWGATAYIDHKWWENAAVLELLGYELEPRVRLARPTPMYSMTRFLPIEWNSIAIDPSPTPRIVHFPTWRWATGWPACGRPPNGSAGRTRAGPGDRRPGVSPSRGSSRGDTGGHQGPPGQPVASAHGVRRRRSSEFVGRRTAHRRFVGHTHGRIMDIEQFYEADERRRRSEEVELGTEWHDRDEVRYEVSWVADTGELYVMREPAPRMAEDLFGDEFSGSLPVDSVTVAVVGWIPDRDRLEQVLAGWQDAMVGDNSLSWLAGRLRDEAVPTAPPAS